MAGQIHGELDLIAQDAQGLQEVSDAQAALVNHLANTLDGLVPAMVGQGGAAMQTVGEELRHHGMLMSTTFADHSQMMNNNRAILESGDDENASAIASITTAIV
ncbi:hypothetical protein KL864_25600 [Mycolicibacterium goodii]|uniref:hypothetical protein n=1 Tax=Mycolicibacterium goodii TaxID=134601 RepID=UPI001BDBF7C4|nr:hypothetical protein [Mycolicibacterium goodii]MBU8819273.1 hypothetical protein [Mycolicibacterium goodii]